MAELKSQKFEIITSDYYSNCLIEAVKAKIHNPKIKITIVMPWSNEVFCPHVLWSDGVNDFDFGNEGKGTNGSKTGHCTRGIYVKENLVLMKNINAFARRDIEEMCRWNSNFPIITT